MTNLTKTATALHERLNNNNNETIIVTMNYDGQCLISRHERKMFM